MKLTMKQLEDLIKNKVNKAVPNKLTGAFGGGSSDPGRLVFEDSEGKQHKAYAPDEKLSEDTFGGDVSPGKILRAKILGSYEGLNEAETKAAGEGIGSLGGWLVPETVSARIIDLARNLAVVQRAGAWTLPMPTPEMRLVKISDDPTAYWVAEHGEISESDWTIEPLNLKAMTVGVLVRASLELLEDAKNSGDAITNSMSKALALEMDRVGLLGVGTSEPRGIDNCAGISTISMGTNGAALTNYDELSEAIEDVADHNGIATAIIMAPRSYFAYDRLKAATTNNRLEMPQSVQAIKDAGKLSLVCR